MQRVVMYKNADGSLGGQEACGAIHHLPQVSTSISPRTGLVRLTLATTGSGMDMLTH